jgi:hypothetical protein
MRTSSILTVLAVAAVLPRVPTGATAAIATDPAGDGCGATGACGFDLLPVSTSPTTVPVIA